MSIFYKATNKQLLKDRNDLFKEVGITSLYKNGFQSAPFKTSWNGEYNKSIQGYHYELARIGEMKLLEIIDIYILNGEAYIQIYLNIFELYPKIETVSVLKNNEGIFFGAPQNIITRMRLRSDDYNDPPLFYMLFLPEHKIGPYFTKFGYKTEVGKLRKLIKEDMENIDDFVRKWHELHRPNVTDWDGNIIGTGGS